MAEVEKPHRKPGSICPLHKLDVAEVCHSCDFFVSYPYREVVSNEVNPNWDCTIKQIPFLLKAVLKSVDGVQGAVETHSNEVYKDNQETMRALVGVAAKVEGVVLPGPPRPKPKLIQGENNNGQG